MMKISDEERKKENKGTTAIQKKETHWSCDLLNDHYCQPPILLFANDINDVSLGDAKG
jgi:hypothetical protein